MSELTIAVTGINASDNPGPGIGIARSLKEDPLNHRIIGFAYDALEPGVYMDWLIDKTFMLPFPSGEPACFIKRILEIKKRSGLNVIIPSLDSELPIFIRFAAVLKNEGIALLIPDEDQYRLREKAGLHRVAANIGVQAPATRAVHNVSQLKAAIGRIGLPALIKGSFYKALRAQTVEDAIGYFHAISSEWGLPVLVQQPVCGVEMNVMGVGDGIGNVLGQMAIKKLSVTSLGKIWTGVTVSHAGLEEACRHFVRQTGWKGPFEMECIVSDPDIFLIEINPRFPAWSYFASGAGMNLPANMVRWMTGQPVNPQKTISPGKLFVRYTYETICNMEMLQDLLTYGEASREKCL